MSANNKKCRAMLATSAATNGNVQPLLSTTTSLYSFGPARQVPSPQHDADAELAVLGAILLDAEIALPQVTPLLKPIDFYIVKHGWVYDAILALRERGESIDFVTVTGELERRGQLGELGGPAFIAGLDGRAPTAYHAGSYARAVLDLSLRQQAIRKAEEIAQAAYDNEIDPRTLPDRALSAIQEWREDSPTHDRFKLHFAREALEPQPPVDWIVDRLFAAGSVAALVGEGGSKKTWTALDAAVAVASGHRWLNFNTQRGMVLIVDEESGRHRLNRRLADVLRGHEVAGDPPIAYVSLAGFNLWQAPDDALALHYLVRSVSARLVIVDALADVLLGGDENSATDTQAVFHALRVVAEAEQCAVVVIHHSNRAGQYRGSSAIKGAVDSLLMVESKPDDAQIDFTVEKNRDGETFTFAALANFGPGSFNLSPAAPGEHFSKSEGYVLRYLAEHGESETMDIQANADICSSSAARQAIYSLAARGKVRRVDSGSPGKRAIYGLAINEPELRHAEQ